MLDILSEAEITAKFNMFFHKSENEINQLIGLIESIKSKHTSNTDEKGKIFETLIFKLFSCEKIFEVHKNLRTTTNELDLLVRLTYTAKYYRNCGILPSWIPDSFIVECKNYDKKVDVTYVGKFISLLNVSKMKLGLFITTKGITGEKNGKLTWNDATGLIKKYCLRNDEFYIVPINLNTIQTTLKNEKGDLVKLLDTLKNSIDLDINSEFSTSISNHCNQGKI